MKTKLLLVVGLTLQMLFLIFVLIQGPEPAGAIQVGLEQLKDKAPSQAAIIQRTDVPQPVTTSGDFFYMAKAGYMFILHATICFAIISMIISFCTLLTLREKLAPEVMQEEPAVRD